VPELSTIAGELIDALVAVSDEDTAKQAQTYFKEPVFLLGVGATAMRRLAREFHVRMKDWPLVQVVLLTETLLPDPRHEVKVTALLLLARFGKSFDASLITAARRWIERDWCRSWAVIDTLCGEVLGPLLLRTPALAKRVAPWAGSRSLWLRRAAAAALVKPARRGVLLDEAYAVALRLGEDREDLVQKATGWLLRAAGKADMARLETFLREHGRQLSRTTVRYAIERFPPKARALLLAATRT
jgi:3-methyladenine DNA glycosylase AlkD